MSHPDLENRSTPAHGALFPHREFPPHVALDRVRALIEQVLRRHPVPPPGFAALLTPLVDIGLRLESAAAGTLTLSRWYRRIAVSVRRCHQAKLQLAALVRAGAMTAAESQAIAVAVDTMIDRLHEAIGRAGLPDEAEAALPSSADGVP